MSILVRSILAALVITGSASCLKDLPAGIQTTVTGMAYDPNRQQPISGSKIYIEEYKAGIMGRPFVGVIDSTVTNNDGSFSIRFKTTGNGRFYKATMRDDQFYEYCMADVRAGHDTTVRFEARKLAWMRVDIHIEDNSRPPLRIRTNFRGGEVWRSPSDTFLYTSVIPNQPVFFDFSVGADQYGNQTHTQLDTVLLRGFNDTFYQSFRLAPDQFKPR